MDYKIKNIWDVFKDDKGNYVATASDIDILASALERLKVAPEFAKKVIHAFDGAETKAEALGNLTRALESAANVLFGEDDGGKQSTLNDAQKAFNEHMMLLAKEAQFMPQLATLYDNLSKPTTPGLLEEMIALDKTLPGVANELYGMYPILAQMVAEGEDAAKAIEWLGTTMDKAGTSTEDFTKSINTFGDIDTKLDKLRELRETDLEKMK